METNVIDLFQKLSVNEKKSFLSKISLNPMKGSVAFITGGNRGIGKKIVHKFASNGANIVFNSSKDCEKARLFATEIQKKYDVDVLYLPCDIRDENQIDAMIDAAKQKFGKIDFLINNAGKAYVENTLGMSLSDWNECFSINLTAVFLFCKKIVPLMVANKFGRVVNISSGTTVAIQPGLGCYMAAKAGVTLLSKGLAKEYGDYGITFNSILPGPTDTDMLNDGIISYASNLGTDVATVTNNIVGTNAIKKVVPPEDVAAMIYFLCTEEGRSITGHAIPVDNGFSM